MNVFLDALSDASAQMTGTLASVGQAFGASWGKGLDALFDRPAALFYLAAFVAIAVFLLGLPATSRPGYQRGRFLTANEKSFLMTLDAALGPTYRAFAQVRLAELASPTLGARPTARRLALNGVMAKSVDFVICDVMTLEPVAAIEVDDKSLPARAPPARRLRQRGLPRDRIAARASAGEARLFGSRTPDPVRARRALHPPSNARSVAVRLVLLAALAMVAIAVFAPNDGAGLMRSVLHGFGWGDRARGRP